MKLLLNRVRSGTSSDAQRFEDTVFAFSRNCSHELAHEAVFEGWLAAHLAAEFGWARLICQAHFQGSQLLDAVPKSEWRHVHLELRPKGKNKSGFNPDVCIADGNAMDCRKSQRRVKDCGNSLLNRFSIVSELKVPQSAKSVDGVWKDLWRLGLVSACHSKASRLSTYMLVIDHHRDKRGKVQIQMTADRIEKGMTRLRDKWHAMATKPVLMICRVEGQATVVDVHRGFRVEPESVRFD